MCVEPSIWRRIDIMPAMQLIRLTLLLAAASIAAAQSPAPVQPQSSTQAQQVWQMQDSGTTAGLRGINSVDGAVAWASGTAGTVLKTIDGGAHWEKCAVPDAATDGATLDFRGVQAWDAQSAIVMASGPGEKSRLYKTTDGCKTWAVLFKNPDSPQGFFDSFHFPKMQSLHREHEGFGLLLGDPTGGRLVVFETRDGGDSWSRISSSVLDSLGVDPVAFAASNSCISGSGGATFYIVLGGKEGNLLLRLNYKGTWWTNDASTLTRTWEKVSLPMAQGAESTGAFSHGIRFLVKYDTQKLHILDFRFWEVAVGGDYTKPNDSTGTAAWSSDGGEHWTASTSSRDDGRTWQPLDDGNWNALSLPFVVGPNGRIARLDTKALPKP